MFRGKPNFSGRKKGRPKSDNPRITRKVCMTETEWQNLLSRAAQFGTRPGETIGILAELK